MEDKFGNCNVHMSAAPAGLRVFSLVDRDAKRASKMAREG